MSSRQTQTCIQDGHACQGSLGCCSQFCNKQIGQSYGSCGVTISSTTIRSPAADKNCLQAGERCRADGSLGTCCSFSCDQSQGETSGRCSASVSTTSTSPGCIRDGGTCHYTGSLGYCCSGVCHQLGGQDFGSCVGTTTTTSSSGLTNPTTRPGCLEAGERCRADGSLGICCSHSCDQLAEQEFGRCYGSTASPTIPPKCLAGGADCKRLGEMGFCCSGLCEVIAPHEIGTCTYSETELTTIANKSSGGGSGAWIIATSVTLSVGVLILLALIWVYRRQKRLERLLPRKDKDHFFLGDPERTLQNGYAHENADCLPYDKDNLEINEKDYFIDWDAVLGSGNFGMVLKGKVKGEDVAVKTIKNSMGDWTQLRSLLSEIKMLQFIGKHDNIVNMVGSNTKDLDNGKVYLFLEYCPLGSLEKYLRANKSKFKPWGDDENTYVNTLNIEEEFSIGPSDLINWCLQVTNAMKYLEIKKVIHADLATRNVLLLRRDCAKLTDFGLSRRLYEYSSYVKKHQEPLPWRHMALEALKQLAFSHQSDVWSLGILYWEVFTGGDVPYPGLSWTMEFVTHLENNLRPSKPNHASDQIYGIMQDCWKPEPDDRPTFEEIYNRLWNCKEINREEYYTKLTFEQHAKQ